MKTIIRILSRAALVCWLCGTCYAGPKVVPHPKAPSVDVRDNGFVVVREFKDPKQIAIIQGIFLRAKQIGDTSSHLKSPTHKIDFADRWLIDLDGGEIGVLSKRVVSVFKISDKDLPILQELIKKDA